MKFFKYTLPLILVAFVFSWIGCGPDEPKNPSVENPEHIGMFIAPNAGQIVKSGEDLNFEFSLAAIPENFEKVIFKIDNQEMHVVTATETTIKHTISTSSMGMGLHTLTAEIIMKGSEPEINSVSFMVISDQIPTKYTYMVRNKFRHDNKAYTQGLEFYDGVLYEGTGLNGKSDLRETDFKSGNVVKSVKLSDEFFGEGITIIEDKIYQLTYQSNKGFVYDRMSLEKIGEFTYATEGWGLTHDDNFLIMSDGTNRLYFLDKYTYERKKVVEVYDHIGPVNMLNELEYIEGEIWANVYLTQEIMRIDPKTGKVLGVIDFSGIFDPTSVSYKVDVLNGIAYDPTNRKIYITGKLWPDLFEVEILNHD